MSAENITINGDDDKPLDDQKGIGIALYYFEFLMRWKYLILGIFISINVLMLLRLLFFVTFYYKATITILPNNAQRSDLGLGAFSSLIGVSMKQESNYERLYEEILRSRRLGHKILTKSFYSRKFGKIMPLLDILDIPEGNEKFRIEMGYLELSGFIAVDHDERNGLTTFSVESPEPNLSVDLAKVFVSELGDYIRLLDTEKARAKRIFIEGRITETEKYLESSEEELKTFRESNKRIEKSPELQLQVGRLIRELRVQEEVYLTLKKEYETVKIEEVKDISPINILDDPIEPYEKSKPKRTLIMILTIIVSGGLSLATAGFLEYFQKVGSNEENRRRFLDPLKEFVRDISDLKNRIKRTEKSSEDDNQYQ